MSAGTAAATATTAPSVAAAARPATTAAPTPAAAGGTSAARSAPGQAPPPGPGPGPAPAPALVAASAVASASPVSRPSNVGATPATSAAPAATASTAAAPSAGAGSKADAGRAGATADAAANGPSADAAANHAEGSPANAADPTAANGQAGDAANGRRANAADGLGAHAAADAEALASDDGSAEPTDGDLDWRAFVPTDAADHLATMDRAARDSGCGVPWHLLAAIARVESDFGRNMATSSAGAVGYGQFLPSSWRAFGNEGNVYDYRDALPAIATYLCDAGLARDPRAALFAYNHAEWYVDLVLELAVRYDRMAPGAPIPGVLDIGPPADTGTPLRYAAGRNTRLQARARTIDGEATWLAVPWRGREPGMAISRNALDTTTLTMLRAAFGLTGDVPKPRPTPSTAGRPGFDVPSATSATGLDVAVRDAAGRDAGAGLDAAGLVGRDAAGLRELAERAWDGDLLPLRNARLAFPGTNTWALEDVRLMLDRGTPVVALVAARALPGHAATDAVGDQPVVLIGTTTEGFVYSDPSFSSSLGYGLSLSAADFVKAWEAAERPRQALGFIRRPKAVALEAHAAGEPEMPGVGTRVVASAVISDALAVASAVISDAPAATAAEMSGRDGADARGAPSAGGSTHEAERGPDAAATDGQADAATGRPSEISASASAGASESLAAAESAASASHSRVLGSDPDADGSWVVFPLAGGFVAGAFAVRRRRGGQSA
jgi:membrane-bound lytic murein transglycosylase B